MINTRPLLRTTLHLRHIGATDERTFILFEPVRNPPFCWIVRRHFNFHLIPGHDADKMKPHLAGQVTQNDMTIGKLHAKQCVGQTFYHFTVNFYIPLMCHVYIPRKL